MKTAKVAKKVWSSIVDSHQHCRQ